MAKNIIVSEQTIRDLLEAHASLSAWYYELSAALRAANGAVRTPNDAARAAFVERLATDFPELAAVAKAITVPRMFVPPPPAIPAGRPLEEATTDEQSTLIEPAQQRLRESGSNPAVVPPASPGVAPPALVSPDKVKYEP